MAGEMSIAGPQQVTLREAPHSGNRRRFVIRARIGTAMTAGVLAISVLSIRLYMLSNDPWDLLVLAAVVPLAVLWAWLGPVHLYRGIKQVTDHMPQLWRQMSNVVERVKAGRPVDVATAVPDVKFPGDELGDLGRYLTLFARRSAGQAVEIAGLDTNRQVIGAFAGRQLNLIMRALDYVDERERDAADPDELDKWFRVDHLLTQMRRGAEDMQVLSGGRPGRTWTRPQPLIDVLRSAVGEVEEYQRVKVWPVESRLAVSGKDAAVLIHLLAALIDNATKYSAPAYWVDVATHDLPGRGAGHRIDILDRGMGIEPQDMARYNARLASPSDTGISTAQLGLHAAATLAALIGVKVQLWPNPAGKGTAAVVHVPANTGLLQIVTPDGEPALPQEQDTGVTYPTVPGDSAPRVGPWLNDLRPAAGIPTDDEEVHHD